MGHYSIDTELATYALSRGPIHEANNAKHTAICILSFL